MDETKSKASIISLTAHILQDPLNPFPWYRIMRERYPIYYSSEFHSWFVSRYSDVQNVIDDTATFSSEKSIWSRPGADPSKSIKTLLWTDPPRHRQLRTLINQAFTPRTIANLAPRITQIVHSHLDAVAAQGTMDLIKDLANPLPIIVIAELLGIPIQDQRQFKQWSDSIVGTARKEKKQAVIDMNSYFLTIVMQRRQQPQDDLISALIGAHIEGIYLTDAEILSFCRLLLVAGHETSSNLIGNALLTLDEHPEALSEVQKHLELLPSAIEEIIRYRTPIQRLRRAATVDIQLGDQLIKAGEIVSPILGSANRDAEQFVDPETFDIHRTPNRHSGFGHGIHYCIGSSLARLEARLALEALLTRFHTLKRVPDVPMQHVASSFVYGVKSLPMTFNR